MAKIFITGSADGLGQLSARQLVRGGHEVVLHARNKARAQEALTNVPGAAGVLAADLASLAETKRLAADVNALGHFDAIIHNAGVYRASTETLVAVNILAPYLLTCLIQPARRLIYLSSGMHTHGQMKLKALATDLSGITYSDSKLHVVMLTLAVARLWPTVYSNAVNPGWVPTKMGGAGASDNLEEGYLTQTWLATSEDIPAQVTGQYFFHRRPGHFAPAAGDIQAQDELLAAFEKITRVRFPVDKNN